MGVDRAGAGGFESPGVTPVAATTRARVLTAPGRLDRWLSFGAAVLLVAVLVAVLRGRAEWGRVPGMIWLHLATVLVAVALTPVLLLRRRGDPSHRALGTSWVAAMLATAVISLFVHVSGPGRFSIIHVLSGWTLIQVPVLWWSARHHNVARHKRAVHGMVIGALLIAGFFTFPFDRLLGRWLFG